MPPPAFYPDLAREVERWGGDLLFATDHLYVHNQIPDALCLLSAYAAVTERLTIGTSVLLPALREPAWTAKQLATIDYLSNGRLVVGVGVGGEFSPEWQAMEIDRRTRGKRTDEYLALFREIWSADQVDFRGEFRSISGVVPSPRPVQPGGPPIWAGGRSGAALRRAARYQGWCGYLESPANIEDKRVELATLRDGNMEDFRIVYCLFAYCSDNADQARAHMVSSLRQRYGQDFDHVIDKYCAAGDEDDLGARLQEYRDAGVQDLIFMPQCPREEYVEQVERLIGVAVRVFATETSAQ